VAAVGVDLGCGLRRRLDLGGRLRDIGVSLDRRRFGHGARPRTGREPRGRLLDCGLLDGWLLGLGGTRLSGGLGRLCSRLLDRRLLGGLLGGLGRSLGKQIGAVLVFELLLDGGLHRRAGCLYELTQVVQHLEDVLGRDVVLLGEFMDSDLGHVVPPGPSPHS